MSRNISLHTTSNTSTTALIARPVVTIPILLLTAKDTVADKVQGLNAGADDYLVKPFAMEELVARLHALCRRQDSYKVSNLSYGDYVLEASTYCLAYGKKRV